MVRTGAGSAVGLADGRLAVPHRRGVRSGELAYGGPDGPATLDAALRGGIYADDAASRRRRAAGSRPARIVAVRALLPNGRVRSAGVVSV